MVGNVLAEVAVREGAAAVASVKEVVLVAEAAITTAAVASALPLSDTVCGSSVGSGVVSDAGVVLISMLLWPFLFFLRCIFINGPLERPMDEVQQLQII